MSPKAIKNLIEMFGVEDGVYILNLFTTTASLKAARQRCRTRPIFRPTKGRQNRVLKKGGVALPEPVWKESTMDRNHRTLSAKKSCAF